MRFTTFTKRFPLLVAFTILLAGSPLNGFAQDLIVVPWSEATPLNFTVNTLFNNGSVLYAGTEGGGVYRTVDGGQNWTVSNTGLFAGAKVAAIETIGGVLFIGTDKGVYRSSDQGQNWTEANNGLTYTSGSSTLPRSIVALISTGVSIFAGAAKVDGVSGINVSIFRSDNLGQSWTPVTNSLPATTATTGFAFGVGGLFAATDAGLYRSTDNGSNWISANFTGAFSVAIVGQSVFAAKKEGISRSNNQGQNWTQVLAAPSGAADGAITRLHSSGINLFAVRQFIDSPSSVTDTLWFSADQGQNWYDLDIPFINTPPTTITTLHVSGDRLFAARSDRRIFFRTGFYSPGIAVFSAASYLDRAFSAESLAVAFGVGLSANTITANSLPLPLTLGNTVVRIMDSAGVQRSSPLLFVSPGQINFQVPPNTADGVAIVTIDNNGIPAGTGQILIQSVAPALFTANSNGYGAPTALLLRIKGDGSSQYETVSEFNAATNEFVPKPIDLGPPTDHVYLVLFGTGFRKRSSLSNVKLITNGPTLQPDFAGPQGDFVGIDQINVTIPRSLAGFGQLFFYADVDSTPSNVVLINIK